tara:strand:+ start:1454 stop:1957 length:504 start_codon:yes stop_codon:yes gene_type:complete
MKKTYKYFEEHKTLMFTPEDVSKDIISQLKINEQDTVLEPFKGEGSFYNQLPPCKKFYCEKDENINFFDWQEKVDWIVSNPPFKILVDDVPKNGLIPIIEHSMKITNKGFGYLINHRIFNALTVRRLRLWQKADFNITYMKVYEIKKWFGRYFFILFEKDKPGILDF